jgi:hypothetical protein
MVNADYDSTEPYTDRYNRYDQMGTALYDYKIVMEGANGKVYPLTLEEGTSTTKTVSTAEYKVGGELTIYIATSNVAADGLTRYYLASRWTASVFNYTANQASG